MSVKLTVHEVCPRCGELAAVLRGTRIIDRHTRCPKAPPGPPVPPRTFRADEVVFQRGNFTADELRRQLDEARAEAEDWRSKAIGAYHKLRELPRLTEDALALIKPEPLRRARSTLTKLKEARNG